MNLDLNQVKRLRLLTDTQFDAWVQVRTMAEEATRAFLVSLEGLAPAPVPAPTLVPAPAPVSVPVPVPVPSPSLKPITVPNSQDLKSSTDSQDLKSTTVSQDLKPVPAFESRVPKKLEDIFYTEIEPSLLEMYPKIKPFLLETCPRVDIFMSAEGKATVKFSKDGKDIFDSKYPYNPNMDKNMENCNDIIKELIKMGAPSRIAKKTSLVPTIFREDVKAEDITVLFFQTVINGNKTVGVEVGLLPVTGHFFVVPNGRPMCRIMDKKWLANFTWRHIYRKTRSSALGNEADKIRRRKEKEEKKKKTEKDEKTA